MRQENLFLINHQIQLKEVLVIDNDGKQMGVMSSESANEIANGQGLDLVLISPNGKVPVCKLMDYNKFKFEQAKKARLAKKNQKEITTKEIQLSLNIEEHDFKTKVKNARKFLGQKNRVNVVLRLRGRENVFNDRAIAVAERFFDECKDIAKLTKAITYENNNVVFVMSPL